MRKNNCGKSMVRIFAVLASIGGVIFLFRDKILAYPSVQKFLSSREDCPICSKLRQKCAEQPEHKTDYAEDEFDHELDNELDDDHAFEHAFDVDPTTEREYVSLNINSYKTSEQPEA